MIAFLRLIRLPNLLMIALTQYLVRWCIIYPIIVEIYKVPFQVNELHFFLLSLSTVLIAAAGYTINDYFDTRIDRINKPGKVVIDVAIKRRIAMGAHIVMNLLGLGIAFYLANKYDHPKLALIHFIAALALWFYSTTLKQYLLIGNIVIALLTAMVPFIVVAYELPLQAALFPEMVNNLLSANYIVIAYTAFAFFVTLIREFTKDAEDQEGDDAYGRNTLPIVFGDTVTKVFITVLTLFVMIAIGWIQYAQVEAASWIAFMYLLLLLQVPFMIMLYLLFKASTPSDYRLCSNIVKGIMVAGILSMPVFYYTLNA